MAEQLNFSEVNLQVTGSSSRVKDEIVQFCVFQDCLVGQDSMIVIFFGSCSVNVWNKGLLVRLAEALIDICAQHVRPTTWMSWLKSSADLDSTPSRGTRRYLDLSPLFGYSLFPSFTISVRVRWFTRVTYSVFIRSRLLHFFDGPFRGIMVVTIVAVFDASLTRLSISELNSPFVSFVTIDLISSEYASRAGSEYWMVLSLVIQ